MRWYKKVPNVKNWTGGVPRKQQERMELIFIPLYFLHELAIADTQVITLGWGDSPAIFTIGVASPWIFEGPYQILDVRIMLHNLSKQLNPLKVKWANLLYYTKWQNYPTQSKGRIPSVFLWENRLHKDWLLLQKSQIFLRSLSEDFQTPELDHHIVQSPSVQQVSFLRVKKRQLR